MRRALSWWLVVLSLVVSATAAPAADPVCVPMGDDRLRCAIAKVSDCTAIRDYPYARNLFCPAAFSAAREMVSLLEQTLGVRAPTSGFFYYYQTLAGSSACGRRSGANDGGLSRYAGAVFRGSQCRGRRRHPALSSGRVCDEPRARSPGERQPTGEPGPHSTPGVPELFQQALRPGRVLPLDGVSLGVCVRPHRGRPWGGGPRRIRRGLPAVLARQDL